MRALSIVQRNKWFFLACAIAIYIGAEVSGRGFGLINLFNAIPAFIPTVAKNPTVRTNRRGRILSKLVPID